MLGSPRRRLPGSRQARLSVAAFGKHPAWRDHIDEDVLIAAPTDELRLLEGWLHGDTFEEFTSKSAINKLSPDNLIPFDHLIVRSGPAGCSLTRLWASTDYSGRAQFPMAISVDADGFGVDDALRRILPALDACAARVREIGTALRDRIDKEDAAHSGSLDVAPARKAVRDAVEALRQQLGVVASAPAEKDPDAGALLRELRAHQDSGPGGQGLARVMYRLERLKPSDGGSRSTTRSQAARRWRLPRAAEADDQSVRRWLAFLSFLAPDVSMITLALPQGRAWVDLFVGDVGMGELERMRLSES
ncbi:MAG TPA: hypothetical protein VHC70_10940, partial [Phycisphaerales bacterium]|nr:hypothetical protein [Phycisphaerales bacterium]